MYSQQTQNKLHHICQSKSKTQNSQQQHQQVISKKYKILKVILIFIIVFFCVCSLFSKQFHNLVCSFIVFLHLDFNKLNIDSLIFYPISNFVFIFGLLMLLLGIIAIISICKKWSFYLYFIQLFFYLSLIFLSIFTISLMSSTIQAKQCQHPKSYIEFQIFNTNKKASDLFCSQSCDCDKYNSVQQCPGWIKTPYDSIFQQVQKSLSCSGWCTINKKNYYTFISEQKNQNKREVSCYDAWLQWIEKEKLIMITLGILIIILEFMVIIGMNCLMIVWQQQRQEQKIIEQGCQNTKSDKN